MSQIANVSHNLLTNVVKFVALLFLLGLGIGLLWAGYVSSRDGPPPEFRPPFESGRAIWVSHSPEPPLLGIYVRLNMTPTKAFVIGDLISANVSVEVTAVWPKIEYVEVKVLFPEAICKLTREDVEPYVRPYMQNHLFRIKEFDEPMKDLVRVFCLNTTFYYPHEGTFGVDTIISTENYSDAYCNFTSAVNIESYHYLEERKLTHATHALNQQLMGLSVIAIGSVAMQFIGVFASLIAGLRTWCASKRRNHCNKNVMREEEGEQT